VYQEELQRILFLPKGDARDDELFAFVERSAKYAPDESVEAARSIAELYKRGWALLLCVKALVHIDVAKANDVAGIIEDEYNRLRAKHTIEFTEAKKRRAKGFDPSWN
jgi:hypothetical protein